MPSHVTLASSNVKKEIEFVQEDHGADSSLQSPNPEKVCCFYLATYDLGYFASSFYP